MTQELTVKERSELTRLECEMQGALESIERAWIRFARAASVIHSKRLYREFCNSFDDYIEQRWRPLSRTTIYEWLQAAGVVIAIESTPIVIDGEARVIDPPARISHARELARLPATEQAPALHEARQMAHERGASEPTTYEVKRVVTARLGEPEPRTSAEMAHERQQRALCDLVRRVWGQIDAERRSVLLQELGQKKPQ